MQHTLCVRMPLAVALLALTASLVNAQDTDRLSHIRPTMQQFVEQQEIAGLVTVIGRHDGILSHEALGVLSLDSRQPMPKDALFRIASMTKPITAIAIMMLAEQGKLSVDDPVEKYLPEFRGQLLIKGRDKEGLTLTKPARPIAIRDLLTHTSGMQNPPPGLADLYVKRNHSLAEGTMAFSQQPLMFEPGSKWSYCNTGIDTLGRIIEVVSGQSYEDFLRQRIFEPLGMTDTIFYPTKDQLARAVPIYDKKDGKLVPAERPIIGLPLGARYPIPAGGLYSTGADLARLYQLMLGRGTLNKVHLLSEESVATMTKVQTGDLTTGFSPGMGFGYGWGVVRTPTDVTAMLSPGSFGHGGAFGTQGWLDPQKDLFIVLLIQRVGLKNSDASAMRSELQKVAVEAVAK